MDIGYMYVTFSNEFEKKNGLCQEHLKFSAVIILNSYVFTLLTRGVNKIRSLVKIENVIFVLLRKIGLRKSGVDKI